MKNSYVKSAPMQMCISNDGIDCKPATSRTKTPKRKQRPELRPSVQRGRDGRPPLHNMSCPLQQMLNEARAADVFMNEKNAPLRHLEKLLF
jgi:hypothetical protein